MNQLEQALKEREKKRQIFLRECNKNQHTGTYFFNTFKSYKKASVKVLDLYEKNIKEKYNVRESA